MKALTRPLLAIKLALFILLSHLPLSTPAYSEEIRYIRDTLFVPLRSGQTFKHRIVHKGLVSGTKLSVIELNEDESYSMVRTGQGIEGWIQTQYLSDEPSARAQLKISSAQHQRVNAEKASLSKELSGIKKHYKDAQTAINKLTKISQDQEQELTNIKKISGNAISLNNDNKSLLQTNQELQNTVDLLTTDNQRLNDNLETNDFLNGAFAVLIGVFITLLVPRLWPSKSSEWA